MFVRSPFLNRGLGGLYGLFFSESRIKRIYRMTRILGMLLFIVAQFIAFLFESRIIADFKD